MTTSRRSFLAGLSAAFAAMPVTVASSAPLHPADRALLVWIGAASAFNRSPDLPTDALDAAEHAILGLPPSIMGAAAILLVEVTYEMPPNAGTIAALSHDDDIARFRILAALRPHLAGIIGRVAADLLDNPNRPMGGSLLWRLRNGEVLA